MGAGDYRVDCSSKKIGPSTQSSFQQIDDNDNWSKQGR